MFRVDEDDQRKQMKQLEKELDDRAQANDTGLLSVARQPWLGAKGAYRGYRILHAIPDSSLKT